ncbi:MAG: metal ABC transporter permease [Saprospiraceae bacterium]|nr:metal ABC transporter permease [Saprospiraceae bacterium]
MLVGTSCGLLGCFIVLRNMSLIGDALSHSILPGIYVAFMLVGYSTLGFFAGSVVAGIITALAITWIQHNVKTKNDAAIGIVFTAMFSLGVMGISRLNNSQGNHLDLKDFLFGNVLGISNEDIVLSAIVMAYTIASILLFYRYFFITTFQPIIAETMGISTQTIHYFLMLMLSFAVVAALRSVGVILVVAMLITPASTAMLLSHKLRTILWISALLGIMSAIAGLVLAIAIDTTPGPAMVVVSTLLFFMTAIAAPERGLIAKWWRQKKQRSRIVGEDIIKFLAHKGKNHNDDTMAASLNLSIQAVRSNIKDLIKQNLVTAEGQLTVKGNHKASELIRAHRLWESYQVSDMGLQTDQIHDDAERLEHHLTQADLDEIDQQLGFPQTDPHGSPIPPKPDVDPVSMFRMRPQDRGKISSIQLHQEIESALWELGLMPKTIFQIKKIDENGIEVIANRQSILIPLDLSKKIRWEKA